MSEISTAGSIARGSLPVELHDSPPPKIASAHRIVAAFLSGRSPHTLRAYSADLAQFAGWIGVETPATAVSRLLGEGQGRAHELVMAYVAAMRDGGLAAATVNRRLAALRALVKLARLLGLVTWALEVPGVEAEPYRDTRGPGIDGARLLLDAARAEGGTKGARDYAILRLLFGLGLRRGELASLDVADVDLEHCKLAVRGKRRSSKRDFTLPAGACAALAAWLSARGGEPGPLFVSLDRAGTGGRLSTTGIYRLVKTLGERGGIRARPHGLRHAAVTAALDLSGGNVRDVAAFTRHRDIRTVQLYDDARRDTFGAIATKLDEALG